MQGKAHPDTEFWSRIRQAILAALDAIERRWGFSPTTAEIRKTERERGRNETRGYGTPYATEALLRERERRRQDITK